MLNLTARRVRKIIIARSDALGDLVIASSAVAEMRSVFPDAQIVMLVGKGFSQIAQMIPGVHKVIEDPLPRDVSIRQWVQVMALSRQLRAESADIFVGLWERSRYGWISLFAGIPVRIGVASGASNRLTYSHTVASHFLDWRWHQVNHNRQMIDCAARVFGKSLQVPSVLGLTSPLDWSLTELGEGPFIAIHLDASNPGKTASAEFLIGVVLGVLRRGYRCVLIGNRREWVQPVRDYFSGEPDVIDLGEKLNFLELAATIKNATGYIGPDSGPAHIAAALGQWGVVYYLNRDQNPLRWMPWAPMMIPIRHPDNPEVLLDVLFWRLGGESKETIDRRFAATQTLTVGIWGDITPEWSAMLSDVKWVQLPVDKGWRSIGRTMVQFNVNVIVPIGSTSVKETISVHIAMVQAANQNHFKPMIYNGVASEFWAWAAGEKTQS